MSGPGLPQNPQYPKVTTSPPLSDGGSGKSEVISKSPPGPGKLVKTGQQKTFVPYGKKLSPDAITPSKLYALFYKPALLFANFFWRVFFGPAKPATDLFKMTHPSRSNGVPKQDGLGSIVSKKAEISTAVSVSAEPPTTSTLPPTTSTLPPTGAATPSESEIASPLTKKFEAVLAKLSPQQQAGNTQELVMDMLTKLNDQGYIFEDQLEQFDQTRISDLSELLTDPVTKPLVMQDPKFFLIDCNGNVLNLLNQPKAKELFATGKLTTDQIRLINHRNDKYTKAQDPQKPLNHPLAIRFLIKIENNETTMDAILGMHK